MDLPNGPTAPANAESVIQKPVTQARELPLAFNGDMHEYFRVWIVNLCITLITFGVFSAWAKVRKKRYLYSCTTLDGTPFQYLGQPLPILKGRFIAATLFLVYYAASHIFTSLLPYVMVAGTAVAPWVIVRSAAFNARYSAFRNITFHFNGSYRDALITIYAWGLIPLLVAGTIFNWWGQYAIAAAVYAVFGLSFPWWLKRLKKFIVDHTSYGGNNGELSATGAQFFRVYLVAGLILVGSALAAGMAAYAGTRVLSRSTFTVVLFSLPVYAGYVLAFAYTQARIANVVWNQTRIGPLHFRSNLRGSRLAKLYLTNALGIIVSLGLLTPWAVIRTIRYRVDSMQVVLDGRLTDFRGSDKTTVQAAGAEVGELFDVDLAL